MSAFANLNIKLKIFLAVVLLVVVLEVVWVLWIIGKPRISSSTADTQVTTNTSQIVGQGEQSVGDAKISLKVSQSSYKVGQTIPVSINMVSDKATDGTDLIILYDSNLLSVKASSATSAIAVGTLYTDYPINIADEKAGRISVSGVTTKTAGVTPNGIFGTVEFVAKAAGKAKISLDFTPGSTVDTNITQTKTAKDILGKVENVEVTITP